MALLTKTTPVTGHDLRTELEDTLESIAQRASDRQSVVRGRLAALENEDSELSSVLNRVDAIA